MQFRRAGTLLIPSGPLHDIARQHLHIICNDTDENGQNLLVSITSWTNDLCDPTCRLEPHEHPWLRHASYVLYRKAQIRDAEKIESGIKQGLFTVKEAMNAQTFLRIRNGICKSPQTPRKIKNYFSCE